jgi:outer membrane protein assembly factor BamB
MGNEASRSQIPSSSPPHLRLWPGLVIVAALWLFFEGLPRLELDSRLYLSVFKWGALAIIGVFVVWWLFLSRVPWIDRVGVLLLSVPAGAAVWPFMHRSVIGYGDLMYVAYATPVVLAAWVIWLAVTGSMRWPIRRVGLWLVVAVAWAYPVLLRFDGATSDIKAAVNFRWVSTPEERFLAEQHAENHSKLDLAVNATTADQPDDWPGFRGRERDGRRPGVQINALWLQYPPRQVWRRRVGPGWGSFTVIGNRIFTQEQRGEQEAVVCYQADTGNEIWVHEDKERFYEAVGGPGPRGTPTFHEGKLYTLGATGRLNCLNAATGKPLWTRDIVADSAAKTQTWGFTASPVVVQGIVTVYAGGPKGKSVLGYNTASGDLAWAAGEGENGYSSTHRAVLLGVEQILMGTEAGLMSFGPVTGKVLWKHSPAKTEGERPRTGGAPITQPAVLGDTDVLYGTAGEGTLRLRVSREGEKWSTKEVWHSRAIKPYFNDMVLHQGYIYGFDGANSILFTCVDLADGKTKWRERGYGGGQVLLLPDQNLLIILTETNDVALVEASPERRKELCKVQLLKGVKSWSHPVVAHGKLFIRNDEEAACYEVSPAGQTAR